MPRVDNPPVLENLGTHLTRLLMQTHRTFMETRIGSKNDPFAHPERLPGFLREFAQYLDVKPKLKRPGQPWKGFNYGPVPKGYDHPRKW